MSAPTDSTREDAYDQMIILASAGHEEGAKMIRDMLSALDRAERLLREHTAREAREVEKSYNQIIQSLPPRMIYTPSTTAAAPQPNNTFTLTAKYGHVGSTRFTPDDMVAAVSAPLKSLP